MYYALIILSVVLFGGSFAIQDSYRENMGSSVRASLQYSLLGALGGLAVLLLINGLSLNVTIFAWFMAMLSVLNGFAFTFCSFKALGSINLSLYSLFSMLGGMLLPFFQGIFFYGEEFTVAKAVCLVFIFAALLVSLKKGDAQRKRGGIYYALIFILNGLAGVISKLFASAPEEWKTTGQGGVVSSADYSILAAICSAAVSAVLLIILRGQKKEAKMNTKSATLGASGGAINKVANWLLVFALAHGIDSSVQYPMVTGGTMIASTLICYLGERKPDRRELLSVALAFVGLLALFVIPLI